MTINSRLSIVIPIINAEIWQLPGRGWLWWVANWMTLKSIGGSQAFHLVYPCHFCFRPTRVALPRDLAYISVHSLCTQRY